MELSTEVLYLAGAIFILTAVLKNTVVKAIESDLIALIVAVAMVTAAVVFKFLPAEFKVVLDMIFALFGAKFGQDAVVKPVKNFLKA